MTDFKKIIDGELESMTFNELRKRRSIKMKKNFSIKRVTAVCAAAIAAMAVIGGTAYAASPEVREVVDNILGINRQSTQDYYEIYTTDNAPAVTDIDIIESALTVTENDFTEFAPGIRAKLVSVVNSGSFAEVLLEFEFDEPVKDGEYVLDDLTINASLDDVLLSYSGSFLTVTDSGKIYSTVLLEHTENIPEDMTMTLKMTALDKANIQNVHNTDESYGDDQSVKINGNFSVEFSLGSYVKPTAAAVEPTEVIWTHSEMGGTEAHMEVTALKYSPKEISVDLRMLEDCLVNYKHGYSEALYFNNTAMFFPASQTKPIKLKMSDGTVKDIWLYNVRSDAVNDIDKSTIVTDMDWIMAGWDIPSDKPATVTFELAGIIDYTDVEAIVFCGEEFPIN